MYLYNIIFHHSIAIFFQGTVNVPINRRSAARESVIRLTPHEDIQKAPQITVQDIPAGGSNKISDEDICMLTMDAYEMLDAKTGKFYLIFKYVPLNIFYHSRVDYIRQVYS